MGFTTGRRFPDYYQALGVTPDASFREIEGAYWRLVKDERGKDKIPLLNEAYETLSRSERRLAYDAERAAREAAGGSPAKQRSTPPTALGLQNKIFWNKGR